MEYTTSRTSCDASTPSSYYSEHNLAVWLRQLDILGMSCGFDLNVICNNVYMVFGGVYAPSDIVCDSNSSGGDGSQQHEMICLWFLLLITECLRLCFWCCHLHRQATTCTTCRFLSPCPLLQMCFTHNAFGPMRLTWGTTIVRWTHSMQLAL